MNAKLALSTLLAMSAAAPVLASAPDDTATGRHIVRTVPLPEDVTIDSATYTPSGKLLLAIMTSGAENPRDITLATINDDGTGMRVFFKQKIPERAKDNGLRYMVFADNRRIFTGDFIIECRRSLERCRNPEILPVTFPPEVADGPNIAHRWSEIVVAPDNRTISWTTLLSNYAAVVMTGELVKTGKGYVISKPQIISTLEPFKPDPQHPDGVIPEPLRGGEVKQFVNGGAALSFAGGLNRVLANSTIQDLATGAVKPVTDTPSYTETTIFSPDEKLGITMSTRFSPATDLAILGLVPRPHPATLNMGLNMFAYTHSVTGVRKAREGNVGPALIDIKTSMTQPGYQGTNLNTSPDWVFYSPMSWHPGSKRASWVEGLRGRTAKRIQIVELPDYRAGPAVPAKATPSELPYASSDMSVIPALVGRSQEIDVKVFGRSSGHITFRRTAARIEKTYVDYSDDGRNVWSGSETTDVNPRGNSAYSAKLTLTGETAGAMDLTVTFGPLGGDHPAGLIFEPDAAGNPQTRGFTEYQGQRLTVAGLVP